MTPDWLPDWLAATFGPAGAAFVDEIAKAAPDSDERWRATALAVAWRRQPLHGRLVAEAQRLFAGEESDATQLRIEAALAALDLAARHPAEHRLDTRNEPLRKSLAFLRRALFGEGTLVRDARRLSRKEVLAFDDSRAAAPAGASDDVPPHALMMAVMLSAGAMPKLVASRTLAHVLGLVDAVLFPMRGRGVTSADSENKAVLRGHLALWTQVCVELAGPIRRAVAGRTGSEPWAAIWSLPPDAGAEPAAASHAYEAALGWRDEEVRPRVPAAVDAAFTDALRRRVFRLYFRKGASFKTVSRQVDEAVLEPFRGERKSSREDAAARLLAHHAPPFAQAQAEQFVAVRP